MLTHSPVFCKNVLGLLGVWNVMSEKKKLPEQRQGRREQGPDPVRVVWWLRGNLPRLQLRALLSPGTALSGRISLLWTQGQLSALPDWLVLGLRGNGREHV